MICLIPFNKWYVNENVIRKRKTFPKLERKKLFKIIFNSLLNAEQKSQKEIKKVVKYKITPVNLCEIDKIEVIWGL